MSSALVINLVESMICATRNSLCRFMLGTARDSLMTRHERNTPLMVRRLTSCARLKRDRAHTPPYSNHLDVRLPHLRNVSCGPHKQLSG